VPPQFRDTVLGGERRHFGCAANLHAACDWNHDSRLLLTFLRRLDGETAGTRDDSEDVEKVDGEHRIEEHLTVGLWHVMPLQPAINDEEVFHFHGEARRFAGARLARVSLTLANRHVSQCFELAGAHFYGSDGLFHERFRFAMTAQGEVGSN